MNGKQFRTTVRDHGRNQVELKNYYPLTASKTVRYALDAWIYSPTVLGLDGKEYNVQRFFADVTCLTGFVAPHMPLSQLIDPTCELSPLVRIRNELTSAALAKEIRAKRVLYELRSLANIYRTETEELEIILSDAVTHGRLSVVKDTIKQNLKLIQSLLEALRELYGLFLMSTVGPRLREAYAWTDEFISLTTEQVLFELHRRVEPDEHAQSLKKLIKKIMDRELEHRRAMGYHTITTDSDDKEIEQRIYRERVLKKWANSSLHLSLEDNRSERRLSHAMGAIAAAAAMSFTVIVTLTVERIVPGRSLPWALAIITAYIFKDRIKESLRNLLTALPGIISDRGTRLVDPASDRWVGKAKSGVRFIEPKAAPPEIKKARSAGDSSVSRLIPRENLIYFHREILIHNRRLRKTHKRLDTLSDTIRLNLDHVLRSMDDPKKSVPTFALGEPTEIVGRRIYHVNLVVCLSQKGDTARHYSRHRLVLSREGLVRLEPVVTQT